MNEVFMMSKEDVLKKLAEITGKSSLSEGSKDEQRIEHFDNNEEKNVSNIDETEDNFNEAVLGKAAALSDASLEDLQKIFGGIIVNKYLMDTRQMTRKEYMYYSKGLKRSELMNHPLMYVMFRSEGQAQVNFFEWIDRFKK